MGSIGSSISNVLNPVDVIGTAIGGKTKTFTDFISDPLDLHGERADAAQSEIEKILTASAKAGIALNEAQLRRIEELSAPFRNAALDVALPSLSALAMGGEVDYQPSQLFGRQLTQGREGILEGQSGGGAGIKSSNTFDRFSDLVTGLASEDVGRFEQGNLSLLQQGIGSEQALNQAGTTIAGNISGLNSNLGQGLNAANQNYGQARQASYQGLQSGLSGLGQLLLARQ